VDRLAEARALFKQALQIDPKFVPALVGESIVVNNQLWTQVVANTAANITHYIDQMDELTAKAVAIDPQDGWAWSRRADALWWQKRHNEAMTANLRARELAPESVTFIVQQANFVLWMGPPSDAIVVANRAIATDPEAAKSNTSETLCEANLLLGAYDDAKPLCETVGDGEDWWYQAKLVALYTSRNETEKAALAKATLLKQQPDITIAKMKVPDSFCDPDYQRAIEQHIYAYLRIFGIPEK
jgi:tetratricopeptide (TPR) repeat protein